MREFIDLYAELVGQELAGLVFVIWIVIFVFAAIAMVLNYVFTGTALFSISKRRGLRASGLAWVPFCSTWVFGSIADQYDRKTKGKDRNYRTWLLIGDIVLSALLTVSMVFFLRSFMNAMRVAAIGDVSDLSVFADMLSSMLVFYALMIPLMVFSVFYYIALFKVYNSCSPKASGWLLALAILVNFSGMQVSIPLLCLRKKDLGFAADDPEQAAAEQKRLELYN